jgi:cytochrome c oxidase subunit IV
MFLPEAFPQIHPLPSILFVAGVAFVIFAVIDFIIAYGLFVGKKWAWVLSIIFSVLGIVTAVFSLFMRPRMGEFLAMIIDLVILFYLMQPRVQAYFKRTPSIGNTGSGGDITGGGHMDNGLMPGVTSDIR